MVGISVCIVRAKGNIVRCMQSVARIAEQIIVLSTTNEVIEGAEVHLAQSDLKAQALKLSSQKKLLFLYDSEVIEHPELLRESRGQSYSIAHYAYSNAVRTPTFVLRPRSVYAGYVRSEPIRFVQKDVGFEGTGERMKGVIIRRYSDSTIDIEAAERRAIEQANNPQTHLELGILAKLQNDYTKAQKSILRSLELDSTQWLAHSLLGSVYIATSHYKKAQQQYHTALQMNQGNSEILFSLGICSTRLGDLYSAKEFFRQAIDANPLNISARNNLGVVLEKLDYYEDAIEEYKASIELSPVNPNAYYGMAVALTKKVHYPEAIVALTKAQEQGHPKQKIIDSMIEELSNRHAPHKYEYDVD